MSWFSVLPTALACLLLLFAPGTLLIVALGLRNPAFLAVAPLLTVSVASVSAIVAPYLGIGWSLLPVGAATVLLAAVLFAIRRIPALRQPKLPWRTALAGSQRMLLLGGVGFGIGALSIAIQLRTAFGRPDNISQTFDNVFHLNAIRYVLDTGNASSMTLTGMTNGGNPPYFYPAAWHGLASLLIQLTGAPLPASVNVLNLCIAAGVWTLGCMFLVRTLVGPNPYAVGAAGVLAAGFGSFPILLLDFGVLYPNFLAVSMLPAALACVSIFFGSRQFVNIGPGARFLLAPMTALGVAIAHPNGVMSLLALSVPVLLAAWAFFAIDRRRAGRPMRLTLAAGAGLLATFGVMAVLWKIIRPPAVAAFWPPIQTQGQALGEVITNSAMQRPVAWAVSALAIVGLAIVFRRRATAWFAGSFIVVALLFVVVSAGPAGRYRDLLTGVWYNDSYRLAALLPVVGVPLAAIGAAWLIERLQERTLRFRSNAAPGAAPGLLDSAGPIIALVVVGLLQAPPMVTPVLSAQANYSTTPDSPLVSSDEMAIIQELDNYVPTDATVAVNPWTGGAMAFAIADRNTTSKHTLTTYTKATELLNDKFREAATDPSVCAAARDGNVRYVLDFGTREVHGGNHGFQGLQIPDATPGFKLLDQKGDAKLFQVTACQ
ncbi:hypothetical protein DC347_08935 [Pseudarthrobacter sp. AG30]|uniref:DUF6541 family protein n=1 Tax=Pseudarthrobacter sp. AG30 TaxID=2249742 RepID=UPI000D64E5F7|nr:DUF6541 family protein [Pseudarthrobacter sp. AG30]RAX17288.1 hypothetical protein DC347_08935 [Pseudarthrobacter sp. AG30]